MSSKVDRMGITETLSKMKEQDAEEERKKKESLAAKQAKKKLENTQKGRWFIMDYLKQEGFEINPKMKAGDTEISYLESRFGMGEALILKIHTHPENQEGYILNEGDEKNYGPKIFHIFVDFVGRETPDFWIVPSEVVAREIKSANIKWINTPGKRVKTHNENQIRLFQTKKDEYYPSNWEEQLKQYYKNIEQLK